VGEINGDLLIYHVLLTLKPFYNKPFELVSVISWQSVLLVGETGVQGGNHRPAESH
jgi:hypothetical protein